MFACDGSGSFTTKSNVAISESMVEQDTQSTILTVKLSICVEKRYILMQNTISIAHPSMVFHTRRYYSSASTIFLTATGSGGSGERSTIESDSYAEVALSWMPLI